MWFQALLAALNIIYELIRCLTCGATATRKKGAPCPSGWDDLGNGRYLCPACYRKTGLEYPAL